MSDDAKEDDQKEPRKVAFRFLNSNYFRVIHADGVFGGVTPQGKLAVGFFSERKPFPDLVVHELDENTGVLGKEVARTGSEGILREIESTVIMDLDTAQAFIDWLQRHVAILRQLDGEVTEATKDSENEQL